MHSILGKSRYIFPSTTIVSIKSNNAMAGLDTMQPGMEGEDDNNEEPEGNDTEEDEDENNQQ